MNYVTILVLIVFLSVAAHANIDCPNKSWFPQLFSMIKKTGKKIDTPNKTEILGKWYMFPKGSKHRSESIPMLEFFPNGVGKDSFDTLKYEILSDRIIYKKNPSNNKKTAALLETDMCHIVIKIQGKYHVPSREEILREIHR